MNALHPEYIRDGNDEPTSVRISISEWRHILNELEELEDIKAYDAAMASESESVPFEQAVREIQEGYNT